MEWELNRSARELLLARYRQASGEDASNRMQAYELAYATFRMAWSRMAAASVSDAAEEFRLMRDYRRYGDFLLRTESFRGGRRMQVEVPTPSAGNAVVS